MLVLFKIVLEEDEFKVVSSSSNEEKEAEKDNKESSSPSSSSSSSDEEEEEWDDVDGRRSSRPLRLRFLVTSYTSKLTIVRRGPIKDGRDWLLWWWYNGFLPQPFRPEDDDEAENEEFNSMISMQSNVTTLLLLLLDMIFVGVFRFCCGVIFCDWWDDFCFVRTWIVWLVVWLIRTVWCCWRMPNNRYFQKEDRKNETRRLIVFRWWKSAPSELFSLSELWNSAVF